MIDKNSIYAVVGVSADANKYGYKVFNDLLSSGFKVFGVNPKGGEILGEKIYRSLSALPQKSDWAVLVVPPAVAEKVIGEAIELGIENVWFQPGSESEQAISRCHVAGINCLSQACIMIKRRED